MRMALIQFFTFCLLSLPAALADQPTAADAQSRRDQQFARELSGATLVGNYTSGVKGPAGATKPERYAITKVSKVAGDIWLFQVRIQYGDHDVNAPLPLRVLWAGDTPVITVDQIPVPGLGTYSARVVLHDGRYAGLWSGGKQGGHLFGSIEPPKPDQAQDDSAKP